MLALILSAVGTSVISIADTTCVSCGQLPTCLPGQWYGSIGTPKWCGSVDHTSPQACTSISKQKWICLTDSGLPTSYGFKTQSDYRLAETCDLGDCY